jgi:hypothetical protein
MKRTLLRVTGLALCVLPPALAVLDYFPLWLADGRKTTSAFAFLLLLLCALPLWRQIKRWLASPSVWMLWLFVFVFLSLFASIIEGLTAVAFFGFLGGLPGALLLKLADRDRDR